MNFEVIEDKRHPGDWRVEAIDAANEGVVYIAIFVGPKARVRAVEYRDWQMSRVSE